MHTISKFLIAAIFALVSFSAQAQQHISGRIIDGITKEALEGATVHCSDAGCTCSCLSTRGGLFNIDCRNCKTLVVSYAGYESVRLDTRSMQEIIELKQTNSVLDAVIVTAAKGERLRRAEAPVAITLINAKTISDARATSIDQLVNKVSGVNMINLGNEQHQMSIRQPMTTKSLFLYLEDGIPVRTTGLFNHNALLEMNMAAVKNIEVIKGPSSSLYGSEAIGGAINFITYAPSLKPQFKTSLQANNNGYKRIDLQSGFTKNKWGFALSGYYADKRNGVLDFSDFHKATITGRIDYNFDSSLQLSNTITRTSYYSDMPGGVDSTMFATHTFSNPQTFTYRKVEAFRSRSTLTKNWNANARTTVSAIYRENSIGQNPNYRIKDDYRKSGNNWIGKKNLAHGELNESNFCSYAAILQHRQRLFASRLNVLSGLSIDLSPSRYAAEYIRITKDTVSRKYISYQRSDSLLTHYSTALNNYAAFAAADFKLTRNIKLVASLRFDLFKYNFDNDLKPSSFSGSRDTVASFRRVSPKMGLTWSVNKQLGFYANYSEGFVPPQVSDLFTGVKVPHLAPSLFTNYEIGGWAGIVRGRLNADISLYQLEGRNEIISVRLDDGSYENQNAGRTSHKGIEFGLTGTPCKQLGFRLSGAVSEHRFRTFVEKGISYSGNEMNNAPRWMHNAEAWYRPDFVKGLRLGVEWQKIGSYFMDARNTARYKGYDLLNARCGYDHGPFEIWLNVMNITDNYFSYISTKTATGQSYQLAEPRTFQAGISYDLASLVKRKS